MRHPEFVVPEVANIAGDAESSMVAAGDEYPPVFVNRYRIDRDRMLALFGDELVNQALTLLAEDRGENPYAMRARDEAEGGSRSAKAPGRNQPASSLRGSPSRQPLQ